MLVTLFVFLSITEYALLDDDLKFDLGHQLNDTLFEASFNLIDVMHEFEHFFDPYLGNCYTYNHFSYAPNTSYQARSGPEYGKMC